MKYQADPTYKERIDLLYKQMPSLLIPDIGTIIITAYVMWNPGIEYALSVWAALCAAGILIFLLVVFAYRRLQPAGEDFVYPWDKFLLTFCLVIGCIWGMLPWVVMDAVSSSEFIIMMTIISGGCAIVLPALAGYYPGYVALATPMMIMLTVRLAMEDSRDYQILAGLSVVFLLVMLSFARKVSTSTRETLKLRFENLDLVAALKAEKEAAERANQAKTRFLAAASHDLRQPLHALGLFSGALHERLNEPHNRFLIERINDSLGNLDDLFDALLDISKLDAGIVEIHRKNFSLDGLLQPISAEYEPRCREKGIELSVQKTELQVYSDPVLLGRILRNLLSNAVKYTDHGSIQLMIQPEGDELRISVKDSGKGIPGQELENIFVEFQQLHNPERDRSKGLGLGLAIVRRLALLLSYEISVSSLEGQGSEFSVTVPCRNAEAVEAEGEEMPASLMQLSDLCVLVVDDEKEILQGMQTMLEAWQCRVELADGMEEALEKIAAGVEPQILISDYRLRDGLTGIELADTIQRGLKRKLPVLLITGDTAPERLQEARQSGYYLLHKPVKPAHLRTALQRSAVGSVTAPAA